MAGHTRNLSRRGYSILWVCANPILSSDSRHESGKQLVTGAFMTTGRSIRAMGWCRRYDRPVSFTWP